MADVVSSGPVDGAGASSWGDLPDDHWENAALVAATDPTDDCYVVACRDPATGEFAYLRMREKSVSQLWQRLGEALERVVREKRCGRLEDHTPHDHGTPRAWCDGKGTDVATTDLGATYRGF